MKLIRGTFLPWCGVIIYDTTTDILYHILVQKNPTTGAPFIEIKGKKVYKEDLIS